MAPRNIFAQTVRVFADPAAGVVKRVGGRPCAAR